MNIKKLIETPTGHIAIVGGQHGLLECLSLADYGKDVNIKCDGLGLSRIPNPVRHTTLLPLTEKWVITISTQYGCSMGCTFCDVPRVGAGRNASVDDMMGQIECMLSLHPEITYSDRLNLHFARMGEPTWNRAVLSATQRFYVLFNERYNVHPVVSSMMPRYNKGLSDFIRQWMGLKNHLYGGNAGLQISVNSTDERERFEMFNGNACTLEDINLIMHNLIPVGRKITLNFAIADYTIDPSVLLKYFDPKHYICKLTPMHKTTSCTRLGIRTAGDYTEFFPYQRVEQELKDAGYDVLVFIASTEEDESRITCGNAILSDKKILT